MDLTVGLVFALAFLVAYFLFLRPKNLPPGPLKLPVIGSLLYFRRHSDRAMYETLHEAARTYGQVMSVQIGGRLAVVLDGYDVIHEALVQKADVFSDRPPPLVEVREALKDIPGQGVVLHHYGDSWRMLRRFTLQALRDFGVGKTSIEEKIVAELEAVSRCLEEARGSPVSVNPLFQSAIGNVIYGIIFGRRYDYDDPDFARIRQLSSVVLSGGGMFASSLVLPKFMTRLISKKDTDNLEARLQSMRTMKEFVFQQIEEHEATFDPDNIRDFVDIYIQTHRDSPSDREQLTKGCMFHVIIDLFLGGSETTSTTLDWATLYMVEYPEVQRRCQKEIDEVIGQRTVEYADVTNLPYVAATVQEIQRLSTIAPLSVAHCAMRDSTLGGYNIPKGSIVLANLYSASFDTKYWDEPEKFRPERFIDENGIFVRRPENIPFSEGPRICLGESLARMELFVILANLLQRFELRREDDSVRHSMRAQTFRVTRSPLPYKLRATRRA